MGKSKLTTEIPNYLKQFITVQDPSLYTPIDHAVWRFILKVSKSYFSQFAHQKYLDGLKETGISSERIPLIEDMSRCLKKFNWQAVAVSGFIPPAVFMEFLSLGILPIACEMRTLAHIGYTPAPDIVHEAAGHAPIIADAEYSDYLRSYGEISKKAIYSKEDLEVYHSIRHLSEVKEEPGSTSRDVELAQVRLDQALAAQTQISEATLLARMGWWTFEYGLVGQMNHPKIYGAGLLSSLHESYHCFEPHVKKLPFSVNCVQTGYDITKPQPQLFVSPHFEALKLALKELASTMAFQKGGLESLLKAIEAGTVTTTELESGIQMSGVLKELIQDSKGRPCYLQFHGPTQISFKGREIEGQGTEIHQKGFGTPLENVTEGQLAQAGLRLEKSGKLSLVSGVTIQGTLVGILKNQGKPILLTFENCTVKKGSEVLFRPDWGTYDMVCGEKVVSVFGGAADRKRYLETTGGFAQEPRNQKTNLTPENKHLNELYAQVRKIRESVQNPEKALLSLLEIQNHLEKRYLNDWLLRYELLELSSEFHLNLPFHSLLIQRLQEISEQQPDQAEIIRRGLQLLRV